MHISFGNNTKKLVHAPSVIPGKWNHIVFELEDLARDQVDSINITPFLFTYTYYYIPKDFSIVITTLSKSTN